MKISKFLSLVLRHRPETIGLSLDECGWVQVDDLLAAAQRAGVPLNQEILEQIVAQNEKQRFAFSEDRLKIRASQGHSISVDLGLEAISPPELLFHGTTMRFVASIKEQGLVPRLRQYVHLSLDAAAAVKVGQRHGEPIVLTIQAGRMHAHGYAFYRSANGVWLTEHVPVEYILFPQITERDSRAAKV